MAKRQRTIQEIFNAVIKLGYYTNKPNAPKCYMCISLKAACREQQITQGERDKASKAIESYMATIPGNWGTLGNALKWGGADSSREAQMNVYLNWDKRPKFNPAVG